MSALTDFTQRLLSVLGDPAAARYPAEMTGEAFRQALFELSSAQPLWAEALHTVSEAGVEQSVASVTAFQAVLGVWFPYDPAAPEANELADFQAWHDGTGLRLRIGGGSVPAAGEQMRVLHTRAHTLAGLDGAAVTTLNPALFDLLIVGAAGHAGAQRAAAILENYGKRTQDYEQLSAWAEGRLVRFRFELGLLARAGGRLPPLPAAGWTFDERVQEAGMPTIGKDCDIMLAHPAVNAGEPLGFLLYRRPGEEFGPPVRVHYESYSDPLGQAADVRHLWFRVLLAERLLNPDGSAHCESAADMRENLIAVVMAHADITLYTPAGLIAGLYSSGHVLIHSIFPGVETVEVQLTSRSLNFAPVDPARYAASAWVEAAGYAGEMNWGNSYWRT